MSRFFDWLESFFNHPRFDPPVMPVEAPPIEPPVVEVPKKIDMIEKWANAITKWEGALPYLNNPGNLKYSTLTASWGGIRDKKGSDGGYFCRFRTLEQGHQALYNFLKLGCENQLIAFHKARDITSFTKIYAGNPPQGYINGVLKELGVAPNTLIETFLLI